MLGDERYLYLGFHGCEKQLAMEILLQKKDFHQSTNDYDWLVPAYIFGKMTHKGLMSLQVM